jgi:hypothetical protein
MKKNIITFLKLGSLVTALGVSAPAQAEMSGNWIAPSLTSTSSGINYGIDSKFGITNNISIRPFAYFPSKGTTVGSALTYDLNLTTRNRFRIDPFVGGYVSTTGGNNSQSVFGFVAGSDFPLSDGFALKAALHVPFNGGSNQNAGINLGAGIRF